MLMRLVLVALAAAYPHVATAQELESTCGAESVTCPTAGDELDTAEPCMSDCDTSTAGIQETCSDFCNDDRCCYTPHVVRGTALTADATTNGVEASLTDTGYLVSWERYSDAACTLNDGVGGEYIDALPISGLSATCISNIHSPGDADGGTPFGWYGYCPGATGKGYYEYTLSSGASQCPSSATAKGTFEGPYDVNTCVCIEDDDGVCSEWGKLSCTPCTSDGANCPTAAGAAEVTTKSSGAQARAAGHVAVAGAAMLTLLA